jgi:hypothetical protein
LTGFEGLGILWQMRFLLGWGCGWGGAGGAAGFFSLAAVIDSRKKLGFGQRWVIEQLAIEN